MSKEFTKEDVIQNKKDGIKVLNKLLEGYINDSTESHEQHLKKANLISKWVKQYTSYILFEEKFNPKRNISYKRGDIVFANFGFNIGAELGGEHYAVVIDKESNQSSSTLTVIPLTSVKPNKEVHSNDVYLGTELYEKLDLKHKIIRSQLLEQNRTNQILLDVVMEKIDALGPSSEDNTEIKVLLSNIEKRNSEIKQELVFLEQLKNEILSLKKGSIAKIKQITTISKIRIYNPKKSSDPLYGIQFSEDAMDKINTKLKEFFVFDA